MNRRVRVALVLFGLIIFLTAPTLTKDLWTPDEPRFALVAKEMMNSGDYLVPRRNNELYREKPPLLFWLIAAASWPVGKVSEFTACVPSVVSALVTLMLTYGLARRMYGERTGVWSALILLTTFRFWRQSNFGQIDMLLTACTTLSLYALWRLQEERGRWWGLGFYAGTALGLLAKGPPALVITGLGAIANGWKNKEAPKNLRLWIGAPLSLVPVLLWFYLSRRAAVGPVSDEVSGTFTRQIVNRILTGVSHAQPPWYYVENLPADGLPWMLFLLWTPIYVWRNRHSGPAMRLLLSWTIPSLVFFHLIVEKRAQYLLPIYPAAAVLVARSVLALVDEGRYGWLKASALLWVPVTLAVAALRFVAPFTPWEAVNDDRLLLVSLTGALCTLWTILVVYAKAWRHWPAALATQTLLLLFMAGVGVFPVMNQVTSPKPFCAPVRALAGAGPVSVLSVALVREEYIFYSDTFHKIVLEFPGATALGPALDKELAKDLRAKMSEACAPIQVKSYLNPTEGEYAALRETVFTVLSRAGLEGDALATYRQQVAREVEDVIRAASIPTPAVIFAQPLDWRWMLAFTQDVQFLSIVKEERVSDRDLLLLANPAAVDALARLGVRQKDVATENTAGAASRSAN